jgi:hypothetical protein
MLAPARGQTAGPMTSTDDEMNQRPLLKRWCGAAHMSSCLCDVFPFFLSPRKWTHWDLNPEPSACEVDVMPLHHEPSDCRHLAGPTTSTQQAHKINATAACS